MRINHTFLSLLLIAPATLVACAQPAVPATSTPTTDATSTPEEAMPVTADYESLLQALRDAGHTVEGTGALEGSFFTGEGRSIKLDGADVQVYEYATPADMEKDAAGVTGNGSMFETENGQVIIDWIDVPHFFKSGRVLVSYIGQNKAVYGALATVLGEQFTGGDINGPGGGFRPPEFIPPTDLAGLIDNFENAGATVETGEPIEPGLFSAAGQMIKVNGQDVQVFEFESEEAAAADAATVSLDGGMIGNVAVRWIAPPRFYRSGPMIVLYVGTDTTLQELLDSALGAPFAGG